MPVNTPSDQYAEWHDRWKRCRDFYNGGDAVKAEGEAYLPELEGSTDAGDYEAYKERASFFNATSRTVRGLLGSVFRQEPAWEFPARFKEHMEDVSLMATPVENFGVDVFRELLVTGRVGVMVDMPREPLPGETGAPRPYWRMLPAESIIAWRTESIAGKETLVEVRIFETIQEPDPEDEFVPLSIEQIRVLQLQDAGTEAAQYVVRFFRRAEGTSTAGTSGSDSQWEETDEGVVPTRNGDPLDFIPFQFISSEGLTAAVARPPLQDIVDMNLSHYRSSADYDHAGHMTAIPTPWVSGVDDDEQELRIGAQSAWVLPEANARAGMLEYTGQGLNALEKALERKEIQMAALGARLIEARKRSAETAESLRLQLTGDHSVLQQMAVVFDQAMKQVMAWHAFWSGLDMDAAMNAVEFATNKDFFDAKLTPQEMQGLMGIWQAGGMSRETLFWNMQRGEIIEPGRTFEEELALIEAGEADDPNEDEPEEGPEETPGEEEDEDDDEDGTGSGESEE